MKSQSIAESKRLNKNFLKPSSGLQKMFRHRDRGIRIGRSQTQ
ncbi:hypothetical protein PCC8801_0957 [Rippkaea orientalis PCC 8801]|uniref:Uncharacterized protein n=1 Tax=Rippkaea orientalis (strain PCC 8801 / RF-1) TaxID=41431 RepID=B7JZU1_RIPO1|nr:hypothetical protein [Rippkaea orientalis]ACK65034.1 hypothetical protein PCC8801_0957 [Rippkaea orientalis PCC 8801]